MAKRPPYTYAASFVTMIPLLYELVPQKGLLEHRSGRPKAFCGF